MTLKEIFKNCGLDDTQINNILKSMKENKIFLTNNQDLESQYKQLQEQHKSLLDKDKDNQSLIQELQSNGSREQLEGLRASIEQLQKQNVDIKNQTALKIALIDAGALDLNYLLYRVEQSTDLLKFDEKGNLTNANEIVRVLRNSCSNQFYNPMSKRVIAKPLPDNPVPVGIGVNQFRKLSYSERATLFNNDPETYQSLSRLEREGK